MTDPSGHHVFNFIATDDRVIVLLRLHETVSDSRVLLDKLRLLPVLHHLVRIIANSTHSEEEVGAKNSQLHVYCSLPASSPTRIPDLLHVLRVVESSLCDRLIVSWQKWRLLQHHVHVRIAIDAVHGSVVHEGEPDELLGRRDESKNTIGIVVVCSGRQ